MLSAALQRLAVRLVGETTDPPGLLGASVEDLAAKYDGLDASFADPLPGISLEDLYIQRDLAKIALGACRANVQTATFADITLYWQQEGERLQKMIAALEAEIAVVTKSRMVASGAAVGLLTAVTPLPLPPGVSRDYAGSRALAGDPYYRPPRGSRF